jgi:hypothetical protein
MAFGDATLDGNMLVEAIHIALLAIERFPKQIVVAFHPRQPRNRLERTKLFISSLTPCALQI